MLTATNVPIGSNQAGRWEARYSGLKTRLTRYLEVIFANCYTSQHHSQRRMDSGTHHMVVNAKTAREECKQ